MKKIFLVLISIGVLFSSCEKFLEEDNLSNVTGENFYITADGFNALVYANYSQLRIIYGGDAFIFLSGTDLYAQGRDAEPTGLATYTNLNSSSTGPDSLYINCYKAIQLANMALYYSEITEQTTNLPQLVGEIKFLRANAYFLLVQSFGDLGIVTDYIYTPKLEFDRQPASEVYKLIIQDLTEAESVVSTAAYTGRVNQRAVKNLLGQVYLTRGYETYAETGDFDKAAALFEEVIAVAPALNIPYDNLWKWNSNPSYELNAEVIFSVQFSAGSVATSPTTLGNKQGNYFGPYMGGADVAGKAPFKTYNLCPTQFAISLYEQGDSRWDATFMVATYLKYYDYYTVPNPTTLEVFHFYEPKWFTTQDSIDYVTAHPTLVSTSTVRYHVYGSYGAGLTSVNYNTIPVKKFDDPNQPFAANSARTGRRDIILARLADTYLLAAEAYLQAGDPATGLDRLNVVRQRAGVTDADIADFDIDYILDERAREMLGEYNRWFDLKRTGKLVERASAHNFLVHEANFNGTGGVQKILRPIPQSALDLNQNKNFYQNPAYE